MQCLVYFSKHSRFVCFALKHMYICAHFNKNIQKNKASGICLQPKTLSLLI